MQDALRRGLFVIMTDLQLADTAQYWVGIDKVYADIMTSISVTVSEETVSEPHVWFLSPSSKTCWGSPVTVRCLSKRGTSVRYTWYKAEESGRGRKTLLQHSSDLQLHCGIVGDGDHYYCNASNSMSSKRSRPISTQILLPAENNCIYILALEGQQQYDCWDRLRTSTAPPLKSTPVTEEYRSTDTLSIPVNHSNKCNVPLRMRLGVPLWYEALRWLLFASLLTVLCLVRRSRKARGIHTNS
ncbi:hypothetical protein AGOR_G00136170 [Albula goreensis]|uniref:Ig-like domain-containing protein n=1 Tax=Albula goreensis TaxID=1534307 RepID=A0A8T3D9C4_9TELE|nr:hypothetical protein AGOR_G00136170 [Albula goreensis]